MLALMASGLDGQRFTFHGYLPVDETALGARLKKLEADSRREQATQAFIETPYRNDRMLRAILRHCASKTEVCVASNLTQPDESVHTRTVETWRQDAPEIGRRPTVFLLLAR
jgi:16S rRNA (cytidine1402-2'-O)-methyltransferase